MENSYQKAEFETLKKQLEHERSSRKHAEDRLRVQAEELAAFKNQLTSKKTAAEGRSRFDILLSGISTHFINLQPNMVDDEIEDAQRRVCECLGLDLCALWQWETDEQNALIMTHLYRPLGGPPVPDRMEATEQHPWSLEQVLSGKVVAISSMDQVPPEAFSDLEVWNHFGIKTTLTVPLIAGSGPPIGAISFNDMLKEREWTDTIVNRLQLVAQIFSNAISRKKADKELKQSENRLKLATDAAGAGLWDMDVESEQIWVSDKTRELFHFTKAQDVNYQIFLEKIHPDDREEVHRVVQETLRTGLASQVDYRVILPDGSVRWISSRGNRHIESGSCVKRLMGASIDSSDRKQMETQVMNQMHEIKSLKQRLENENLYLQQEVKSLSEHGEIIGQSLAIKRVLEEAQQVAQTDSTILILGETGTGKEMMARFIYQMSGLKNRPMVTINCASLPPSLIESELFGREKGAYTGALTKMIGRFEVADGSTLFLDEIGELPVELQGKLLRVLEEGVFERLGSTKPIHVNVRIIAATNRDITNEVENGNFRSDLFYRLNVFPIVIPPLRERPDDIPPLVWSFVKEFKKRMGKDIEVIPKKAMDGLQSYAWPGNVRELRNVIEHAMILSKTPTLAVDLPRFKSRGKDGIRNLEDIERHHIVSVLKKVGWRVGGKGGAAEILGLKRPTLYSKMRKLGIARPRL